MSVPGLETPLAVLSALPTAMNWRGTWDATTQYYQHDVVVSPITTSSYILTGKTTLLDGGDPSTNADWFEISAAGGGISSVVGGLGIQVNTLGSTATVNNTGVRTLTVGAGLTNVGTATDPILENSGIRSILPGTGIEIAPPLTTPTITAQVPRLLRVATPTLPYNVADAPFGAALTIPITQYVGGLFDTIMTNGPMDPNAYFVFDLSGLGITVDGPSSAGIGDNFKVDLVGPSGGYPLFYYPNSAGVGNAAPPYPLALGSLAVKVSTLIAATGNTLTTITVGNATPGFTLRAGVAPFIITALYYPAGLE